MGECELGVVPIGEAYPGMELRVVDELAAGAAPGTAVSEGEAIRIMTGAPMPPGADAVVMVEDSERIGDHAVRLTNSVPAGAAVRREGDDVRVGDELFPAGTTITPAVAAVLASVNADRVAVSRRARVPVLSTGDELVDDGSPLQPGQIRESNKTMLAALAADVGCEVVDLGVIRDDEAELERVLRAAAADCDAIVSSGGVSMGDIDLVQVDHFPLAELDVFALNALQGFTLAGARLDHAAVELQHLGLVDPDLVAASKRFQRHVE